VFFSFPLQETRHCFDRYNHKDPSTLNQSLIIITKTVDLITKGRGEKFPSGEVHKFKRANQCPLDPHVDYVSLVERGKQRSDRSICGRATPVPIPDLSLTSYPI
jgi:hypothetical protein